MTLALQPRTGQRRRPKGRQLGWRVTIDSPVNTRTAGEQPSKARPSPTCTLLPPPPIDLQNKPCCREMHPAPGPSEKPAPRGVLADELLPVIRGLAGRSFTEWETGEIDALVAVLAGVRSIDVAHASAEAQAAYGNFDFELSRLVESRPDIAERIDPVYIFVDITAGLPRTTTHLYRVIPFFV